MQNRYLDYVRYRRNIGHVNAHGSTLRLPRTSSGSSKSVARQTKPKAPAEPTPPPPPPTEESIPPPSAIDDKKLQLQYEIEQRDEQIKLMQTRLTQSQQRQQELEATLLSFESNGEQEFNEFNAPDSDIDELRQNATELNSKLEKVCTMLDNMTVERDEHARRAEALAEGVSARKKEISELKDKLELSNATVASLEQELRSYSSSSQVDDFHPDEDYSRAKMKQMEREVRSLFGSLSMVEKYVCELDVAAGQLPADEPSFDHIRTLTSGLSNALDTEITPQREE